MKRMGITEKEVSLKHKKRQLPCLKIFWSYLGKQTFIRKFYMEVN